MNRLIIVAGAGGAGKSFFLRMWANHDPNAQRIKKFVSAGRAPREIEIRTGESDLIFDRKYDPNTEEGRAWYDEKYPDLEYPKGLMFHDRKYNFTALTSNAAVYDYHGSFYEVDVDSINEALNNGKNPIVIVRRCATIRKLLQKYSTAVVIYVQSILSGQDLIDKLVALGESTEDARKRQGRNTDDLNDYISSIQQLPSNIRVVINDFNESYTGAVFTQIRDIYQEEFVNYKFKEKTVFVIQSYANNAYSTDVFDSVKTAVQQVLGKGNNVFRADFRQDGSYMIPEHVWDSLDQYDCIVCDITNDRCNNCSEVIQQGGGHICKKNVQGVSPNVWLELGYALARLRARGIRPESRLIVVCKVDENTSGTVVPIDLGGTSINVIRYNNLIVLMRSVQEQIANMYK